MLARLTEVIAKHDSNIRNIDARTPDGGRASIEVVVEIKNQKQLQKLSDSILALPEILSVHRQRGAARSAAVESSVPDISRQ